MSSSFIAGNSFQCFDGNLFGPPNCMDESLPCIRYSAFCTKVPFSISNELFWIIEGLKLLRHDVKGLQIYFKPKMTHVRCTHQAYAFLQSIPQPRRFSILCIVCRLACVCVIWHIDTCSNTYEWHFFLAKVSQVLELFIYFLDTLSAMSRRASKAEANVEHTHTHSQIDT